MKSKKDSRPLIAPKINEKTNKISILMWKSLKMEWKSQKIRLLER